nr:hypothetical protein [Tanacetum cinerariifolium]
MQTQTSNTLHKAIMEAGSKDRPPMLAPGNYVQWKSRIKRYIDTKPNHELIHYCLENPPYKLDWQDIEVPVSKGSPITTTERIRETYKNVSQDINDQLNDEAEAVQIILTGIDNDIYSTVDDCLNACEMWKAIERLKQGESINVQDLETNLYWEFGKFTSQDGESLESYYLRICETYKNVSQDISDQLNDEAEAVQIILTGIDNDIYSTVDACPNACEMWKAIERFYKMMNELIRFQCKVTNHQVNVQFLLYLQPEWKTFVTLVKQTEKIARVANLLTLVAQQQPVYHPQTHPTHYTQNSSTRSQQAATRIRGKAIANSPQPIYDQEPSMVAEDDETSKDKEIDKLMALISLSFKKIYKPTNNNLRTSSNTSRANQDNSPRINRGTGYENQRNGNVTGARETVDAQKVIIDSLDMNYDREEIDQNDDNNDLAKERELLASLIEKLKCETDENKNRNKFLETSNKALIEKLKGEIEDFKNKNKSLESSNNFFKEANNKLSETNNLLYAGYKKSEAELARRDSKEYASQMELKCAKVRGVIPTTSVSRPQLKSNPQGNRLMHNNSQGKKQAVEDHRRSVKLSKNKKSVTACNDSLNAKTLNVKSISATKLYERVSKTCSWWYPKFIPSGYKWKPKSEKENMNLNVSMPLGNASRTANVMETMTSKRSTVSNTPLSSNSFAARQDCSIHRRL